MSTEVITDGIVDSIWCRAHHTRSVSVSVYLQIEVSPSSSYFAAIYFKLSYICTHFTPSARDFSCFNTSNLPPSRKRSRFRSVSRPRSSMRSATLKEPVVPRTRTTVTCFPCSLLIRNELLPKSKSVDFWLGTLLDCTCTCDCV